MIKSWHSVAVLLSLLGVLSGPSTAVHSQSPPSSSRSEVKPAAGQLYQQGTQDFRQGDYQAAAQAFEQALKLDPQNAEIHSSLGVAYLKLGDRPKAMAALNQAIQLNPRQVSPYLNRGAVRMAAGDAKGAIADLQQAIKLAPQKANAYVSLCGIYSRSQAQQQALNACNQAIQLDGNNPSAYLNRAEVYLRLQNQSAAIADYQKAAAGFAALGDSGNQQRVQAKLTALQKQMEPKRQPEPVQPSPPLPAPSTTSEPTQPLLAPNGKAEDLL